MVIEPDAVPSRVSGRTRIPSIRAREAAEVASISAATAASKKKRATPRQSTSTPTTSGFSGLSLSPKAGSKRVSKHGRRRSVVSGKEKIDREQSNDDEDEEDDGTIYCLCRKPDNEERPMIQCETCEDW